MIKGFVKASEDLPDMEKIYHIKDNVGMKRLGNFFEEDGEVKLSICSNGAHESFIVHKKHFDHYEWLDESIEEQAGETVWQKLGELKEPIEGIVIIVMGNGRVFAYDSEHTMAGLKNVIEHHPEALCLQLKKPTQTP